MTQPYARILLCGAYLVNSIELLRPVVDNPRDVASPLGKAMAVAFAVCNVLALVAMRPRRFLLILSALNAMLGIACVVALSIQLLTGSVQARDFDTDIAVGYFVGLVPLVAAGYFFSASRAARRQQAA